MTELRSGTLHAASTREGDRKGTVVCHSRACLAREESRVFALTAALLASGMR